MDLSTILAILLPLVFIIYWLMTFLKNLTNKQWSGAITQAIAAVAAFGVVALYAHSSIDLGANSRQIFDKLGWADQVLIALAIAAGGGTLHDGYKVFNNADPSTSPPLLPGFSGTGTVTFTPDQTPPQ